MHAITRSSYTHKPNTQAMSRPTLRATASLVLAVFLALAFSPAAQAQMESESTGSSGIKVGPRATVALNDISDFGGDFAIGGDVRYDLSESTGSPIQLSGAFDFYFVDDRTVLAGNEQSASAFTVDLNGLYSFPTEGNFSPYAGAGLGIVRTSVGSASDSDVGLNLTGGAELETESFRPFAQAQLSLGGDFTRFGITAGVLFPL